jgi:thiol-disulfide isomerase/thioredoxin
VKVRSIFLRLLLITPLILAPGHSSAHAQGLTSVVRAVLFYSPTCGHCHYVITETLPPLFDKYGERLQIIGIDVTQSQGQTFFLAALQRFGLESGGVPFLVIDDLYLVGSQEIPERFPGLIETYLAQGSIDWPDIPGLTEWLAMQSESTADPSASQPAQPQATPVPTGNMPHDHARRYGCPGAAHPRLRPLDYRHNGSRPHPARDVRSIGKSCHLSSMPNGESIAVR